MPNQCQIVASRPKIAMLVPTRPITISRLLRANSDLSMDWPTNACMGLKVAMSGPNMAEWWPYKTVRVPYNQDWAHKAQVRAQRDRVEAQKVWMAKWASKMPCLRLRIIKLELNMAIDGQTGLIWSYWGPIWPYCGPCILIWGPTISKRHHKVSSTLAPILERCEVFRF